MSLFRPVLSRTSFLASARTACFRQSIRYSSTASSDNTVLSSLKPDLKDAMRAKNKPALNAIRALQAEIINASKTSKPVENDAAFYSLLQKKMKAASTAIEEFQNAKREDLVAQEQEQLNVLQKYADAIPKVAESEIDELIKAALEKLEASKRNVGSVMGKVMGGIKGRPVDTTYLTKKIEEAIGGK